MSTKPPIAYIEIRVFAHATEDPTKVQTAIQNLLPLEPDQTQPTLIFDKSILTGHHGNPITLFTTKLEDKKHLPKILEKIGQTLSTLDKQTLETDIKLHIEKGNLYLRFDKQSACTGSIKFTQNDPIHVKVHFKDKTPQEIIEFLKTAGLLP
jgi:RNA-binding protein